MAIAESFLYLFQADTSSLIKGEKDAEKQNKKLEPLLLKLEKNESDLV